MQRSIRDCNVCVVGGAGFLGSHLVDHLIIDRHCKVLVIDNLISGRKDHIHSKAKFEWADITGSESNLYKLLKHHEIQYVFNYAAEPYIPVSFKRPLHVFDINAMGALKLINASQEVGVQGILQMSSAEIYGHDSNIEQSLDEDCAVVPHSTYGVGKAAIDALIQVRWKEAETPCIALRQFNCLGERDAMHPYIVPTIIQQIHEHPGLDVTVRLGNNSFRDFLYAGDAVRMATELLEKGQFGEVYNLGSEEGIQMYDLAVLIGQIMGKKVKVEQDPARIRPWEIWWLKSCNNKIHSVIDYRPQVSLGESIRLMVTDFYNRGCKWEW